MNIKNLLRKIYHLMPYSIVSKRTIHIYRKYEKKYSFIVEECKKTVTPVSRRKKIIWVFWEQGFDSMPVLCKKCYRSIEKYKPNDYEIVFLNLDNYSKYISLPTFILKKFQSNVIGKAHFSDLIRLALLIKYGGIWIDPTVFFTSHIPNEILTSDLFLFKGSSFEDIYLKNKPVSISNWFISSNINNPVLTAVFKMLLKYWSENNKAFSYYIFHQFFSIAVQQMPEFWNNMYYYPNNLPHYIYFSLFNEKYDDKKFILAKKYCFCHKLTYKYGVAPGSLKQMFFEGVEYDL